MAIEQLDDKNPGLLINAASTLVRALDHFAAVVEECLGLLLEKTVGVLESRRGELVGVANKLLLKVYQKCEMGKVVK